MTQEKSRIGAMINCRKYFKQDKTRKGHGRGVKFSVTNRPKTRFRAWEFTAATYDNHAVFLTDKKRFGHADAVAQKCEAMHCDTIESQETRRSADPSFCRGVPRLVL